MPGSIAGGSPARAPVSTNELEKLAGRSTSFSQPIGAAGTASSARTPVVRAANSQARSPQELMDVGNPAAVCPQAYTQPVPSSQNVLSSQPSPMAATPDPIERLGSTATSEGVRSNAGHAAVPWRNVRRLNLPCQVVAR